MEANAVSEDTIRKLCENTLTYYRDSSQVDITYKNLFQDCTAFQEFNVPNATGDMDSNYFYGCANLTYVDAGHISMIGATAFYGTGSFVLVIRNSSAVVDATASNALMRDADNYIDAEIYVPSSLLSTYQATAPWSNISSQIHALEGSNYETAPTFPDDGDTLRLLIHDDLVEYESPMTAPLKYNLFRLRNSLERVSVPNATGTLPGYAFNTCPNLEKIYAPNITGLAGYAITTCAGLVELELPQVKTIAEYGLHNCSSIETLDLENATTITNKGLIGSGNSTNGKLTLRKTWGKSGSYPLYGCTFESATFFGGFPAHGNRGSSIKILDLVDLSSIPAYGLGYQAYSLNTVIIRKDSLVTCSATTSIRGTSSTFITATIYVPEDLVDTYKANSTWSNIASQITQIEGTEWETKYANGEAVTI